MRLCTWLGRHKPFAPVGRRNRHRLSLVTLESRDVPAAWYTVQLNSPPQGTLGESAASITSGSLHVDSAFDPDGDGTALVYAVSGSEAIRLALTGAVTVDLSVINLPQTEYAFSFGTSSLIAADHKAFLLAKLPTSPPPPDPNPIPETITAPGDPDAGAWRINLEDLAAHSSVSDWDYNDFFWTVTVGVGTDPWARKPRVSVTGRDGYENERPASFTLLREGEARTALPVAYSINVRDVASGQLLQQINGSVTFAIGHDWVDVAVPSVPHSCPSPQLSSH